MIIKGKTFDGTFDYEYTDGLLKLCAGNTSSICEFRPIRFPNAKTIYNFLHAISLILLLLFSNWNVCPIFRRGFRFF